MTATPTRTHLTIPLRSALSPRFQPTGFPDLGAAEFEAWDAETERWVTSLLVESPQSMANHLENVGWDTAENQPAEALAALPYVRVAGDEDDVYRTSSRTEAHRLASAFIMESSADGASVRESMEAELGLKEDMPIDHRALAAAVFRYDPLALLHGVFFSQGKWVAQPKIARAVTAVIEATDVRRAESGGVKFDNVRHRNVEGGGSSEGYGTVPHHRTEYTAREIVLRYSLDRVQLASYGLSDEATQLLEAIADWQLATLLDGGLRLRTACEFEVVERPAAVGDPAELTARISDLAAATPELTGSQVLTVRWPVKPKKK